MEALIDSEDIFDHLAHYGVLGMKWGVRKDRNTGIRSGQPTAGKKRPKRTKREQKAIDSRRRASENRRTLSDQELTKRIERLKKEKELKKLTDEDVAPGKVLVRRLLSDTGNKAWGMVLAGAAGGLALLVKTQFDKKADGADFEFDYKDVPRYVMPNPNRKK